MNFQAVPTKATLSELLLRDGVQMMPQPASHGDGKFSMPCQHRSAPVRGAAQPPPKKRTPTPPPQPPPKRLLTAALKAVSPVGPVDDLQAQAMEAQEEANSVKAEAREEEQLLEAKREETQSQIDEIMLEQLTMRAHRRSRNQILTCER